MEEFKINFKQVGMYCYYDVKSDSYDVPFFSRSDVSAKRKFFVDCTENPFLKYHKNDFHLTFLGTFDMKEGIVDAQHRLVQEGKSITNELEEE